MIPVEPGTSIGACFHPAGISAPTLLFFHGNGEVVSDYHDIAALFTDSGLNFFPVDYRGYGRSDGTPTVTDMMKDCHAIVDYVCGWTRIHGYRGPLAVMGRSLGSAPALDLAARRPQIIDGLVIESGFAQEAPLLKVLGIPHPPGMRHVRGFFQNADKISAFSKPLLVIHAENDHIISFDQGRALFNNCPSETKAFLPISGAHHNDIFSRGLSDYMDALKRFRTGLQSGPD